MAFNFPDTPTVGQVFGNYTWDGLTWQLTGGGGGGGGTPSTANPIMDGIAAPGVATPYSREDHVHPSDTSRAAQASLIGRNRIINGQFAINQRNAAGGVANNAYSADRWRVLTEAASLNIFANNFNAAGANVPGGTYQFGGTADKGGAFQVIEGINCKDLRGLAVTLSMLMSVSNARLGNMKIGILEWTGTEDATSATPIASWGADGVTPTLAANWAFKNVPANLGATTGSVQYSTTVTLGAAFTNLAVLIWNDDKAYAAGDNFSVSNVQLEAGAAATKFDQRLISQELALCQRYCTALGTPGGVAYELLATGEARSATLGYAYVFFPVTMRAAPTAIFAVASNYAIFTAAGSLIASAVSIAVASVRTLQIALTIAGGTPGQSGSLQANAAVNAYTVITAEI